MSETLIASRLLEDDYYAKKIPLYLRNNGAFMTHFQLWLDLLQTLEPNERVFLDLLNIFDNNYLTDSEKTSYTHDMLDKIGAIFNLQRSFTVTYTFNLDNTSHTDAITLNNEEYLLLIKAQVIRDYFDGSHKDIDTFYRSVGLSNVFQLTETTSAHCTVVFMTNNIEDPNNPGTYRDLTNTEKLFLAGMLSIESLGITYTHGLFDAQLLLYWDVGNWDSEVWS